MRSDSSHGCFFVARRTRQGARAGKAGHGHSLFRGSAMKRASIWLCCVLAAAGVLVAAAGYATAGNTWNGGGGQ